jgi:hypothetical protein
LPWGDIRETEVDAEHVLVEPEMSDDDFNTVLAQAIRLANADKD